MFWNLCIIYFANLKQTVSSMDSREVERFDAFYHSKQQSDVMIIGDPKQRQAMRTYAKSFTNPRAAVRTVYRADLMMECVNCSHYTNIKSMKSEWADEMASGEFNTFDNTSALADDMCLACDSCGCTIRFSNDLDTLKFYKQTGRVRFGKWKATGQVTFVKEPFRYPKLDWGHSYRKHYDDSKHRSSQR